MANKAHNGKRLDAHGHDPDTVAATLQASMRCVVALSCWLGLAVPGCNHDPNADLVCPLLAPGALEILTPGRSLRFDQHEPTDTVNNTLPAGQLGAHGLVLGTGQQIEVTASMRNQPATLLAYGPRDPFGGFPPCLTLAAGEDSGDVVRVTLTAEEAGEYVLLVGATPPAGPDNYQLSVTCVGSTCQRPATALPHPVRVGVCQRPLRWRTCLRRGPLPDVRM